MRGMPDDLVGNFFGVEQGGQQRGGAGGPARRYKNDTSVW